MESTLELPDSYVLQINQEIQIEAPPAAVF
jgi:hypothetical protein